MRNQSARDKVTVEIATGIVLFVLVLFGGGAGLWLIHVAGGELDGSVVNIAGFVILGIALAVAVGHVYRHRKP